MPPKKKKSARTPHWLKKDSEENTNLSVDVGSEDESKENNTDRPVLKAKRSLSKPFDQTENLENSCLVASKELAPIGKKRKAQDQYTCDAPPEKIVKIRFKDSFETVGQTLRSGKVVPTTKSSALVKTLSNTGLVKAQNALKKPNGKSLSIGNLGEKVILSPTKKKSTRRSNSNLGRKTKDTNRKKYERFVHHLMIHVAIYQTIIHFYFRENEEAVDTEKRLEKLREYYNKLPKEQYENKLDIKNSYRANETELRRSRRLETIRTTNKMSRMLNPKREKDAYEKWKQRYKKYVTICLIGFD